jgi:catechol 2,3-dioxygenase-like lactoylglutathione lyase family enzyme
MRLPNSAHRQSDSEHGDRQEATQARQSAPRPVFSSVAAQLFVADIEASCAFFSDKLGFKTDFVYGEPPFYGQLSRDNARLALRQLDEPVFAGDIRAREDLLSASITVETADEIEQLFLGYQAAGVPFHQVLRKEPWGARTFIIVDLDGNLILFAGPAD